MLFMNKLIKLIKSMLGIEIVPNKTYKILWCNILRVEERSTCFKKYFFGIKVAKIKKFDHVRIENGVQLEGGVSVGRYSYICSGSKVFRNAEIGSFCSVGNNVIVGASAHPQDYLSTHPFQYEVGFFTNNEICSFDNFLKTVIGHDVWIGSNAVIKGGVKVGNGAIIGCGAVVTKDVPPYAVMTGVPAKVSKMRFSAEIIAALEKSEWWMLSEECLKDLPFADVGACVEILKRRCTFDEN